MRVYYDTEFIEDGRTIDLISIGMVADDGRELYLVNRDMPERRIRKHPWLMAHVVPGLPKAHGDERNHQLGWLYNRYDPCVKRRPAISALVCDFLAATPDVELWTWYGAYDHVALAQLFGPMVNLPDGVPMWSNDLRQEYARVGEPAGLPEQPDGLHNALADARHLKVRAEWLARAAKIPPRA